MKKRTIKRNILSVLAVLVMLMATLLTACSNQSAAAAPAKEEATEVKEDTAEVEQVKEEVAEPEHTAEPTPEPEVEDSKYPGIDMESTLPGLEWMATFDEIDVDEPIIVVYNDETNKKVIINEGDEVEFSKSSDTLAFYSPDVNIVKVIATPSGFTENWDGSNELSDALTATRVIFCSKGVTSNDSSQKCTALARCNGEEKEYKFVLKFVE
mgnify:CR=1 FL=1